MCEDGGAPCNFDTMRDKVVPNAEDQVNPPADKAISISIYIYRLTSCTFPMPHLLVFGLYCMYLVSCSCIWANHTCACSLTSTMPMDLNRNCDLGLVTRLWLDLPKFQVFCLCNILPFCEFLDVLFFYILIVRCRLCRSSDCKPEDHRAKLMSSRDNNNTRERDNNNSVEATRSRSSI